MAITGWEWIIVVFIVLAIFLWGPQKLPQLARAIGQARREFEKASKEYTTLPPIPEEEASRGDDVLIATARRLGISTEGKTKEQISQEIIAKSQPSKQ
jgi:sec-independent protein translocase protein TatA